MFGAVRVKVRVKVRVRVRVPELGIRGKVVARELQCRVGAAGGLDWTLFF